jgi:RND family efflux transporter MFP subunit
VELPEVTIVRPVKREITEYLDFNGQSEASASVEIRPRLTATLTRIVVLPGTEVKRGDLLFELDARALELTKQKAEAQVRQAQATLDEAKNALADAKNLEKRSMATPNYTEKAAFAVTHALAAVNAARAQWDQAQLDLDAAKITAPMAGRVGGCPLSVGSLATPSTTLITLVACEPIKVVFDMDEHSFMRLRKHLPGVGSGPMIAALMSLPTEEGFPRGGFVESVDNRFNPATGTIRIGAVFPNPHHEILPGMFVRIRLLTDRHEAILVPEESIWSDQGLKYVRVVNGKNAIEQRKVSLGQIDNGLRSIREGLSVNDRVVTKAAGQLHPGEIVKAREVPMPNQDSKAKPGADQPGSKK